MRMEPVAVSSNVKAIGYDAEKKMLRVEFTSGAYDYHGVDASHYQELLEAESKGKYINVKIKPNYECTKCE